MGREGYVWPTPPLTFFALSFLIGFFRACRQFSSRSRKIIENLQYAVQIEIFSKNTFFCPTTYSGLCSSDHPCMKILFLVGFFGLGMIYSENFLMSVGHLQKLCKLFPQAVIYLKGAMLIYMLMPP